MKSLAGLALRSLWNRRDTAALTVFSIAVSVALLLGVLHLRDDARASFANTLSGADLVVGSRSSPVNLLLYSVFRIGDATNPVSMAIVDKVARHPDVAWVVPISLGDSHRGYRVLGTMPAYFEHWRYGHGKALAFTAGAPFADLYDAVLGAEVAQRLGYRIGDALVLAHGVGEVSFANHDDKPFRVAGVLARTGTPVDRTVHIGLQGLAAMHVDWTSGAHAPPAERVSADDARHADLTPTRITAFVVGMKARSAVFLMQRALNEYANEPLTAVIPGVALTQLWQLLGVAEGALLAIACCVVAAGLLGMLTAILTSLNERRREMAILRSVGARPRDVFMLLWLESCLLASAGALGGILLMYAALIASRPLLLQRMGVAMELGAPTTYDLALLAAVIGASLLIGAWPAVRAYRRALADGLSIRL
ncbi:MAG: ABC transporter permease [Pseudomonadota bacterium]